MKKLLLTGSASLILFISGCGSGENAGAKQESSSVNAAVVEAAVDQSAPDFTLTGVDGKSYSLSEFKGATIVLEWINFDCPFVKAQYASGNIPALQKEYTEMGVIWLTICSSAPGKQGHFEGEALTTRMKAENWSGTAYLIDEVGTVGKMYSAKTTPNMYVIDTNFVLRYAGAIDDTPSTNAEQVPKSINYVRQAVDAIMVGSEITTKVSTPYGCSVKYAAN